MSLFTYRSSGYFRKTRALPVIAVLALILFHLGTAAAQPSGDSLNLPPAGTQLAFVRDDQIWLVNADGTGLVKLTDTGPGIENRDPAWSRDGQRLAFAMGTLVGGPQEIWDIYIMDADGSNVIQLTHGGYNVEPTWGPGDREIAFTSTLSGNMGLAVIDLDAAGIQEPTILLTDHGWISQPAWSPDGRTITFTSDYRFQEFVVDVYAMNADGSEVRHLLPGPFVLIDSSIEYYQSAWSPDGHRIAVFACHRPNYNCYAGNASAIAVVNADGSGLRKIAQAGGYQVKPTWSSDGRWIAFASTLCHDCQSSIRFVHVDEGIEGLIVDDGHSPSWRPDGGSQINAGHSGAWYSPATSAQGQFLDINPDNQFVFLGWPTFTLDDSESPNEQHWFTAAGKYHGSRAELTLYESIGGRFDDAQAVTTTAVGDVTLTFFDCNNGSMSYSFDDREVAGSFSINRAIPGSSNLCESQTGSMTQDMGVNPGMDGLWIDVSTSGQGFFFDTHDDDAGGRFILASWLTYGDTTASGQRWLTAQGQFQGSSANLVIYESSGGSFNSPKPAETVAVGTMSITFSDCNHANLSYSMPSEGIGGTSALQRAMPIGDNECEVLNATR